MSMPLLTIILTDGPPPLTLESWTEMLTSMGVPLRSAPKQVEDQQAFTAELDNGTVLGLIYMPSQLPGDDLLPFRRPSMAWPSGAEGIDAHKGHVVVTALGNSDALQRRHDLTLGTVATAERIEALGIYWGDVPQVTTVAYAAVALPDDVGEVPAPLWMAVDLAKQGEQISAFTRGLRTFDHPDLWISSAEMDPIDLHMYAMNLGAYIINGTELKPGHTIGETDDERIPIESVVSPRGDQVLRIRLA